MLMKRRIVYTASIILIWLFGILFAVWFFPRHYTPRITSSFKLLYDCKTIETNHQGDTFSQEFISREDAISGFLLGIDYETGISEKVRLRVEVYRGDQCILTQPLTAQAIPRKEFLRFGLEERNCKGEQFTIRIVNISENTEEGFRVMVMDEPNAMLPEAGEFRFNDRSLSDKLAFGLHYQVGHDWYESVCGVAAAFLLCMAATAMLLRGRRHENVVSAL